VLGVIVIAVTVVVGTLAGGARISGRAAAMSMMTRRNAFMPRASIGKACRE